jgi:predicted dehydrogenase
MKNKTLNVAVIGTGGICKTHMPGWAASKHARVVAGADISEKNLKAWGDEFDVTRLTTEPDELIADPRIDVVDICTPNRYHADLSIAALNAGKHVICEKPLAPTPGEIRRMIEARDSSGKLLMTGQHMRFSAAAKALKAEIDTGSLGDVYHARAWMLRRAAVPLSEGFILKKHSGGGPCIDIGVHVLDLTLWLMGHPKPVSVTGVARRELASQKGAFSIWGGAVPKEIDVEDFAAAFVRFDNSATLILEVSWMLHHDTHDGSTDSQVWLYGTKGGMHHPSCKIIEANNETQQHYDRCLRRTGGGMKPHAAECVAFAQAITDGAPSPVPPEQSLSVQTILDALYRSQESGKEIILGN